MGYATLMATCLRCGALFTCNPAKVPSIRVKFTKDGPVADPKGSKEPICAACVDAVNPMRVENGLAPITYAADAYEACEEGELG